MKENQMQKIQSYIVTRNKDGVVPDYQYMGTTEFEQDF